MSDSSIDEELFGNDPLSLSRKHTIRFDPAPSYISSSEFKNFSSVNKVRMDKRYGYISVFLSREYYFPG
jgi:hypothetical protein